MPLGILRNEWWVDHTHSRTTLFQHRSPTRIYLATESIYSCAPPLLERQHCTSGCCYPCPPINERLCPGHNSVTPSLLSSSCAHISGEDLSHKISQRKRSSKALSSSPSQSSVRSTNEHPASCCTHHCRPTFRTSSALFSGTHISTSVAGACRRVRFTLNVSGIVEAAYSHVVASTQGDSESVVKRDF